MLLYTPMAAPPVSYDNSATTAYENTVASGTPFTWTHNPTTAGSYAIVALFGSNSASIFIPASTTAVVTFGGQAMTSLGVILLNNVAANGWVWVFGLPNAPGGSNTVSVTLTEAAKVFQGFGTSYTYNNVASVGTLQSAFGSSAAPTLSVPSAAGNLVWGAIVNASSNPFTAFSLSTRQDQPSISAFPNFWAGDTAGAASTVVSATTTNFVWAAAGLNLSRT